MEEILILDETNGTSFTGLELKKLCEKKENAMYFTSSKTLLEYIKIR